MLLPRTEDTIHKAWLYRLLITLADDTELMQVLRFKGGTCAAMAGFLHRFSVDLDFDYLGDTGDLPRIRKRIEQHTDALGLEIKDSSKNGLQYFLKYPAPTHQRNTIKLEAQFPPPRTNEYAPMMLSEIDRTLQCQTIETMFANTLVAVMDRYQKTHSIAGRDIYDIHQFFLQGLGYRSAVIEERWNMPVRSFFEELIAFIAEHVTQKVIDQDINTLVPHQEFQAIRKTLKQEVIAFLHDEYARVTAE
jgi:predicted nucleotidyltransferase component of viral defense system